MEGNIKGFYLHQSSKGLMLAFAFMCTQCHVSPLDCKKGIMVVTEWLKLKTVDSHSTKP